MRCWLGRFLFSSREGPLAHPHDEEAEQAGQHHDEEEGGPSDDDHRRRRRRRLQQQQQQPDGVDDEDHDVKDGTLPVAGVDAGDTEDHYGSHDHQGAHAVSSTGQQHRGAYSSSGGGTPIYGYGTWPDGAALAKAAYSFMASVEIAKHHFVSYI